MKKSEKVILTTILLSAISCNNNGRIIDGLGSDGKAHDTIVTNNCGTNCYRYYHNSWYPIHSGQINTSDEPMELHHTTNPIKKTGGFGKSAKAVSGRS